MTYDFMLRVPAAARTRRKRGGISDAERQRIERARELLRAFEPDIAFSDDDDAMFTAISASLGEVYVERDRISLGFSLGAGTRYVYSAIHGLLACFEGEPYEAVDPQLGAPVHYVADFAEFMQQYRGDFRCNDEEFAQWCRGETPPAWAERAATRERGSRIATAVFPRPPSEAWLGNEALDTPTLLERMHDATAHNDALIREHGLLDYMRECAADAQRLCPVGARRLDGSFYPCTLLVPWMQRSLLMYECRLLHLLRERGVAQTVLDQPQHLELTFEQNLLDPADTKRSDARIALVPRLAQAMRDACPDLIRYGGMGTTTIATYSFYGRDTDAMHAALLPLADEMEHVGLVALSKRYGDVGSRLWSGPLRSGKT